MRIHIVAATIPEIEPLIETPGLPPYKLIITGIGVAATTYHLTKQIGEDKPDLVIQAGVAGGFDSSIPLGMVSLVQRDRFADLGVAENGQWRDVFDLKLSNENDPPFNKGWLVNTFTFIHHLDLPLVSAITINEITTSKSRIDSLRTKYQPALESMEGAALHFVCLQENIPFLQLRALSNYVGERDKSNWRLKEAILNLNKTLMNVLEEMNKMPMPTFALKHL